MRAVWNALIEFQEEIQGENLLIRCENATVVAYINKQRGTTPIPQIQKNVNLLTA
jgi:hypothetical protein